MEIIVRGSDTCMKGIERQELSFVLETYFERQPL